MEKIVKGIQVNGKTNKQENYTKGYPETGKSVKGKICKVKSK